MALILSGDTGVPASGMPAGSVIQTVIGSTSTTASSATATLVDTNLTATITPTFSTSKILVMVHQNGLRKSGGASNDMILELQRNGTQIIRFAQYSFYTGTSIEIRGQTLSTAYLDSPATTSAVTYKTQMASAEAGGTVYAQNESGGSTSTITLLEIKQ